MRRMPSIPLSPPFNSRRRWAGLGLILSLVLIGALLAAACGGGTDDDERLSFTFMAGFRAQSNLPFVAAYVAEQEGFFEDVNLDVTIQHSSGQGEHIRLLLSDDIDLTTQPASEVIQRRADPGAPLVVVTLFGQTGDLGYAVLEDSGIESPADFAGRTVGFKSVVQAEFLALLNANGLSADDVDLVGVGFNPVILPEGQVDVYPVFLNNEPDILQRVMGVPIRVFQASDAGVPTLGVAYVVTEDLLADDTRREALRRFLTATMRGFQFALADPAAAIEATRAFISEDADLLHERFLLDIDLANAISDLTRANGLGWFTEAQFQALHDVLLQFGGIEHEVEVADMLDRSVLESIDEADRTYGGG